MLIKPECLACIYRMSLAAIREVVSNERAVKELMSEIVQMIGTRGVDWSLISSELIETFVEAIGAALGNSDPFQHVKERQNLRGMELYPTLKTLVSKSEDQLHTALHLAILGNSVDVMWSEGSIDLEPILTERLEASVPDGHYSEFKTSLENARTIVYLTDNSGEIIFDKVLIETLREIRAPEITCVVRSEPTINDVTRQEARTVGLDEVSTVIDNGIDGPLPGTILTRCSEEVRRLLLESDLVIAKGGGNFDTLDEEKVLGENTYFLLVCKCVPYKKLFGSELYHPVLWNRRFCAQG